MDFRDTVPAADGQPLTNIDFRKVDLSRDVVDHRARNVQLGAVAELSLVGLQILLGLGVIIWHVPLSLALIHQDKCISCGACLDVCPTDSIRTFPKHELEKAEVV